MCLYCHLCADTFFQKDLFGGEGQYEVEVEGEVGHLGLYSTRASQVTQDKCVCICVSTSAYLSLLENTRK